MPIYALLGATGATGSSILRCLLTQPPQDLTLNIFVRSRSKLLDKFPDLNKTTILKVNIVQGTSDNADDMQECLEGAEVVMGCIGSNESVQGITLVHDTVTAIVSALEIQRNRQGSAYKPPTVIQLRSTSLNPVFKPTLPWAAQIMAPFCFYYIYEDVDRACKLLVASGPEASGLLNYIFIDPPSIHDADGTTPTGYELILEGTQNPVLSYADLGAAFCEVAVRKDEFAGKGVAVSATGSVNETWGTLMGYMLTGAKSRIWG